MAAGTAEGLRLFSEYVFHPPADAPELVAACPTVDLTAAAGGGNAVYVRRRGGEIVSKLAERNKAVQALAWKADGQFLAVAWSDGVVRLAGLESPKAVHQIRLFDGGAPAAVTYISWTKNLVGSRQAWRSHRLGRRNGDGGGGGGGDYDDGYDYDYDDDDDDDDESSDALDLPRAVMFLEVEDDLPKLPPLPVSGGSGDDMFVFSTRTSLEFMFAPLKPRDGDAIHVMVLGTADGAIHVSIYDTFVMGTFTVPLPGQPQTLLRLRRHAAHPASSTHALLLANEGGAGGDGRGNRDRDALYLAWMDLTFVYASPLPLSLLAYKTTTFQKLLRYIKQTQVHMQGEWQTARELPARFLASIQDDLQQNERRYKRIDHALRVAVLTGYVSPTLKQWLVDTIAERGHKRWDKAVVGGLQNLRDLLHENLMPALDRAALALGRLRGLAEFHSHEDGGVGFSADEIGRLLDMVSCLVLAAHNALGLVTAELELFVVFSAWLRTLIERLALPAQAEEQADKEPQLSVTPVLDYIANHLLASPLDLHFGKVGEPDWSADWRAVEEAMAAAAAQQPGRGSDSPLLDKLEAEMDKVDRLCVEPDMLRILHDGLAREGQKKQKEQKEQKAGGHEQPDVTYMKAFPTFEFLTKLFATHADGALKAIAESGRRHVHFGPLTRLAVGRPVVKAEMAMAAVEKPDPEESADALACTAVLARDEPGKLHVFRSSATTDDGVSTAVATQSGVLDLGSGGGGGADDGGRIVDFQFLGAGLLLILVTRGRQTRLVAVPTRRLAYADDDGSAAAVARRPATALAVWQQQEQQQHDGLCWVADATAGEGDEKGAPAAAAVARMEVLGPRRAGSDKLGSGRRGGRGRTARVCLLQADGTRLRVLSLPREAMGGGV